MKELITLIQPAFEWTWKNSVQAAVLIGLVLLVQKVLGRWLTPRLRYALSLLILFRLLLPVAPPSALSLENLFRVAPRLATREAVSSVVADPTGPMPSMASEPIPVASPPARPVGAPSASATRSSPPAFSVAEALGLGWACGLLALVFLAGWRYIQWCRLIRQGRRLSDTRLNGLLDGARESMGVRRPVRLVAVAQLGSPAVFGFWRVCLLLPEDALEQFTDRDLRLLFLHEMAHVRRQDMLLNVLLMTVQFVYWFNPLVWVGLHRLRADRELVCDAMVLQRTRPEERSDYGGLLLKMLGDFPAVQRMIPTAVPVVSSKREIKRRIVSIKHHRSASRTACAATGLAVAALACFTFTGSSQQPSGQPLPAPVAGDAGFPRSTNLVVNIDAQERISTLIRETQQTSAPDSSSATKKPTRPLLDAGARTLRTEAPSAVSAVVKQSGTNAPKLIRLKSNGNTVAELRIPKGTMFEVVGKESNYDVSSERLTANGGVTVQITYAGSSSVIVKTDEIEAATDSLSTRRESTRQAADKSSTISNYRFVENLSLDTKPRTFRLKVTTQVRTRAEG